MSWPTLRWHTAWHVQTAMMAVAGRDSLERGQRELDGITIGSSLAWRAPRSRLSWSDAGPIHEPCACGSAPAIMTGRCGLQIAILGEDLPRT